MLIRPLFLLPILILATCQKSGSSHTAEQHLHDAWSQFRLNEFAEAEASFNAALSTLPPLDAHSAPLRANATYGLALLASLAHHGDQSEKARALFDEVIRIAPQSDEAVWAGLAIIRDDQVDAAFASTGDAAAADHRYADFIAAHPHTAAADEAFVEQMTLRVQKLTPDEEQTAITSIDAYLKENPVSRVKSPLFYLLSKAHQVRGEYPEALAAAIDALDAKERNPDNPNQNNIPDYYRIGMMAQYDVGDFATARKYYALFLKEYPRDLRAFDVKRMLQHLDATEAALRAGQSPPSIANLPPTPAGGPS